MSRVHPLLFVLCSWSALACQPEPAPESAPESTPESTPTPTAAQRIPLGERAFFHAFPLSMAAFGALERGSRVDIVATFANKYQSMNQEVVERTFTVLLQNISVLDVFPPQDGEITVSLSLTHHESNLIDAFLGKAALKLLVRHPEDVNVEEAKHFNLKEALTELEFIQPLRNSFQRKSHKGSTSVLREPHRRVGVELSAQDAVIRTFRPGDRVDLHGRFSLDSEAAVAVALPLLQNVLVLDVFPALGGLNLELTQQEAGLLSLMRSRDVLRVNLRNPQDTEIFPISRQTFKGALLDLEIIERGRHRRVERPHVK